MISISFPKVKLGISLVSVGISCLSIERRAAGGAVARELVFVEVDQIGVAADFAKLLPWAPI